MQLSSQQATLSGWIAILLWSMNVGFMKSITESFGMNLGMALLYTAAGMLLLFKNGWPSYRKASKKYLLHCGSLFVLYNITFPLGIYLAQTPQQVLEVGMVNYSWPCMILIFSLILFKQRATKLLYPGILLAFTGIFLCIAGEKPNISQFLNNITTTPLPYLCSMITAVSWGLYCNIIRNYSGEDALGLFFLITGIVFWIIFFFIHGLNNFPTPSTTGIVSLCAMSFFYTFSFLCWEIGMKYGNVQFLAASAYLIPVFSTLFGMFWFSVQPSISFWYGVVILVIGSFMCWRSTFIK